MKQTLPALVIDDDSQMRRLIADTLKNIGWAVREAENADRAFEILPENRWALVFCDVKLGGTDGYEVLRRFVEAQPQARFFLMTGYESASGALEATASGAYDYLVKPFTVNDILTAATDVRRDYERRPSADDEPHGFEKSTSGNRADSTLIGRSPSFIECMKLVGRVAATNMPVLITGESGTGKEMVARAIHQRSRRAGGNFVAVNCGALPVDLIESELFGHARGSFTGASSERVGLWEEANDGTILLDEITETSPLFQIKLLRALQEGEIRRVGSNRVLKVDVRVIAATNRDIEKEVEAGRFRQDLMYRLNVITINLPPLRERREDIAVLTEHFARRARTSGAPVIFSAAALEMLAEYEWQGNIRELENAVFHAVSICEQEVRPEHLPARVRRPRENFPAASAAASTDFAAEQKWVQLAELEADYVARVLAHTAGNKQAAAHLLGIDRKRLTRIIKRYNLDYKMNVVFDRAW